MLSYGIQYATLNESDAPYTVVFPDDTVTPGSAQEGAGCSWTPPNHVLYQMAHTALLVAFLAPSTMRGTVFFHGTLVLGE